MYNWKDYFLATWNCHSKKAGLFCYLLHLDECLSLPEYSFFMTCKNIHTFCVAFKYTKQFYKYPLFPEVFYQREKL